MSSTAVVLKSYEDMGLKDKPWASQVFGTLVVEDLIAILLMVLLSTLAVSNNFKGGEMFLNLGKLLFFLILWFLIGIFVIPTLLKRARKFITDEILLIVSIGLCFGMVTLATSAGYSTALGAFLMGSILAETVESEHIEKLLSPIKDLFSAIFFVSVGMMINPAVLGAHWAIILLLTVLVMVTHIVFSATGIIITGNGLTNGVHTGFSLAQLGEFGFIIAGVGASLGVMSEFIYPVIISVSVITTFTTPYMIKLAGPADRLLQRKLPEKTIARLQPAAKENQSVAEQGYWKRLLKSYFIRILLYGVILTAIFILSTVYFDPLAERLFASWTESARSALVVAVTLLLMFPFLVGMTVSSGDITRLGKKLIADKETNRLPLMGLMLVRSFIGIAVILGVISTHFDLSWWAILLILVAGVVLIIIARRKNKTLDGLEKRFLGNLNQKEEIEKKRKPVTTSVRDKMAGYDVHLELVELSPDSKFVGCKIREIPFRSETGANIIKIERGSRSILVPDGETVVYPFDRLLAVGTTSQIVALRKMVSAAVETTEPMAKDEHFDVRKVHLKEDSFLTGMLLRETNMRDYRCMVISVLRGEEFMTNPRPDMRFQSGDIVWIAGETASLNWLKS